MHRGNPYHDERGRFTSPGKVYSADRDAESVNAAAHSLADSWQMSFSEVDPEECVDGWGTHTDSAYQEAMDAEFREKYEGFQGEVAEIYTEYNTEMNTRISKMGYKELNEWSQNPDAADKDIREKIAKKHSKAEFDSEDAVTYAAEDYDTEAVDRRYKRVVTKTNGKYQLYEMAMNEKDGYGLNGYAEDYASRKIKNEGLTRDYENYKLAKAAYARGENASGKKASDYKDEKSYIRAKMKSYRKADEQIPQKQKQFERIYAANPMTDDTHTGIRSFMDIKSFDEAMGDDDSAPDFTTADIAKAKSEGIVTIFSSKPIKVGTFVTPSKMEAQSYAGSGKVYSKKVNLDDVAWIDGIEGQFAGN